VRIYLFLTVFLEMALIQKKKLLIILKLLI